MHHSPLPPTWIYNSWVQVLQFLGWWRPSVEVRSSSVIVRVTPGSWTTWNTPVPSMESQGSRLFPSPGGCSHRPCCSWTPKMWYWRPTASTTLNVCLLSVFSAFAVCSRVEMESWIKPWKQGYSIRSWNVGCFFFILSSPVRVIQFMHLYNLHTLDFEDVLATVAFFFEKNPKCKFWTTYQERRYSTLLTVQHTVYYYIAPYGSLIPLTFCCSFLLQAT